MERGYMLNRSWLKIAGWIMVWADLDVREMSCSEPILGIYAGRIAWVLGSIEC